MDKVQAIFESMKQALEKLEPKKVYMDGKFAWKMPDGSIVSDDLKSEIDNNLIEHLTK